MFTTLIDEELKNENWVNVRMKKLLAGAPAPKWADAFCCVCRKHHTRHDDAKCSMRYEEEAMV